MGGGEEEVGEEGGLVVRVGGEEEGLVGKGHFWVSGWVGG